MAKEQMVRIPIRTCAQCGKPVVLGMKECFVCGTPVAENGNHTDQPPHCPQCGKELAWEATVCSLCGTRLRPESVRGATSKKLAAGLPGSETASAGSSQNLASLTSKGVRSRIGMSLGTIAFLLLGFFLGKLLLTGMGSETPLEPPPAVPSTPSPTDVKPAETPAPSAPPIQKLTPAPSQGLVVTATELLPIRTFGAGAVAPTRSVTVLRERIEEFLPSIRSLYNEKFASTGALLGTVVLELTIAPEGHITEVVFHTTGLESFFLLQVIQSLVQEWQFAPAAAGTTVVFYPLLFIPPQVTPGRLVGLTKGHLPGRYRLLGTEPLSVRSSRSDDAPEIGKVSPGLRIDVVGTQGEWLTILSPKGQTGYVHRPVISARVEDGQPQS